MTKMKKLFILISAAALAFSCMDELADTQVPVDKDGEYKTITFDVVATKTVVDGEGNVEWENGDEISLYYYNNDGTVAEPVIATADDAGAKVTFTAQIPVDHEPTAYYATYPKGAGLFAEDGSFMINVTADNCDGTFKSANFAVAYTSAESMSFSFTNAVGMVKVALPKTITRDKDNTVYNVNGIYLRGTNGGSKLQGKISVTFDDNGAPAFGDADGVSNVYMTKLSAEALNTGVAYIPCAPSAWTQGICVDYLSADGDIPAVLSKANEIKLERGHILPLADVSSKVIFDWWVSATGDGDGKTAATPMSIAKMLEMISSTDVTQANAYHLKGSSFNFTEGTHSIESTITIPAHKANVGYNVNIDGNENAILQGASAKVFDIKGNATIKNLTIQGANVSTLSGAAANGAAITVNPKTIVTLENLTIQNNKAKSGGAVFVSYSDTCSDDSSVLDCVRCKFISNTATAQGGALIVTSNAKTGGAVRFNECLFEKNNSTNEGGAVLANGKILMMLNKCSFFENKSTTKGARDIYAVNVDSRLALNNCTLRGSEAGTAVSSGSSLTTKCLSIVANSTFWGNIGAWGCVALGSSTKDGSLLVNNVINNRTASKPGLYFASSYYQNVKYCIYTGTGENDANGSAKVSFSESKNLGLGGAFTGAKSPSATEPYTYYYFTWDWDTSYPCPTLQDVRTAIKANPIGQTFLDWLDGLEEGGALSTDIAGNKRPSNAMCPGSYQQAGVVANNN